MFATINVAHIHYLTVNSDIYYLLVDYNFVVFTNN